MVGWPTKSYPLFEDFAHELQIAFTKFQNSSQPNYWKNLFKNYSLKGPTRFNTANFLWLVALGRFKYLEYSAKNWKQ